jgi:ketosteroid isomerase-like protein
MGDGSAIVERYKQALQNQDMSVLDEIYADDAVQEWPQSGERIVGKANIKAINENYPGFPKATERRTMGSGDIWILETELDYDGQRFNSVSILEIKDGKIAKETDYFGSPFEAPEWRSQWVEKS